MNKKVLRGPGIAIELDKTQVFHDNPGMGTPALVILRNGREEYTATYNCAVGEREVDGIPLDRKQIEWLEGQEPAINDFLY